MPRTRSNPEEERKRAREENERLRRENEALKKENKDLKNQLERVLGSAPMLAASDRTAEAGGVPTSKVFYRRRADSDKKPTGGQPGHKGYARPKPEPNAPPVVLRLTQCPECSTRLGEHSDSWTSTITDLPKPEVMVYEVVTLRYTCPGCGERVQAQRPGLLSR